MLKEALREGVLNQGKEENVGICTYDAVEGVGNVRMALGKVVAKRSDLNPWELFQVLLEC